MVSTLKQAILLLFIPWFLIGSDVVVTSEMNYTQLFAGSPLTGSITITHNKNDLVDTNSFKLGGKPLKPTFLNDVVMSESSSLIVSLYSFEIPTLPKGLHVLPEVTVMVGNKTYKSYSTTFEVFAAKAVDTNSNRQTAPPTIAKRPVGDSPELLLEAKVEGRSKLYPGEQTKLVYRFLYRGHVDLTKEVLPLLDGVGLKKVGDKLTRDYEENQLNVSEFAQIFEGDKPGTFEFGPSIVEGRAFTENANGERIYAETPLHSEAPSITIQVLPFPDSEKPASFNGAIGKFIFQASLGGSKNLAPGEKLTLLLEITGDPANLSTVQAPDLCCQPGFSGMFKPSDLPPISSKMANTKRFLVELTPLSSNITEIPPIEFSSFDPASGKYLIVKSEPIPLNINLKKPVVNQVKEAGIQKDNPPITKPLPIEIAANQNLTSSDLDNKFAGTWWNLLWVPTFVVLLMTLRNYKKELDQKKQKVKNEMSDELFKEALQAESGSVNFYRLIQKALITALFEKGDLNTVDIEPENLEKTGLQGDVKIFLVKLNEVRFSGNKKFDQAIILSAKELFSKIKGTPL